MPLSPHNNFLNGQHERINLSLQCTHAMKIITKWQKWQCQWSANEMPCNANAVSCNANAVQCQCNANVMPMQ